MSDKPEVVFEDGDFRVVINSEGCIAERKNEDAMAEVGYEVLDMYGDEETLVRRLAKSIQWLEKRNRVLQERVAEADLAESES